MSSPDQRGRALAALTVFLLTGAALLLRLVGLDSMLPYHLEPDHGLVRTVAWLDRPSDVTVASPWAGPTPMYPWLMPRILQALPGSSYPEILSVEAPLEDHLASASRPFHQVRLLAAFLSALAVPFTYALTRSVLGRGSSLFATALVAASVLLQNYGQQGRAHGPMAGLSALALVTIVAIPRSPTWTTYLAAGAASGLAMACLQTGGFVLPAFLAAHLLSRERRRILRPLAALGLVAVFVALFYPSIHTLVPLKREGTFNDRITEQLRTLSPLWEGLTWIPRSLAGTEPVLSAIALVGAAFLVARLFRDPRPARERLHSFLVCGAFVAAFLLFWVALFPFRPRYLTSLVPCLAILGAYGAREARALLLKPVRSAPARDAVSIALALLVLSLPVWTCLRLARLRSEPDTAQRAAEWLEEHADRERESVALGLLLDLPILEDRAAIKQIPDGLRSHWQRYLARLPAPEPTSGGPADVGAWRIHPLTLKPLVADGRLDAEEVRVALASADPDFVVVGDRGPGARERDDTIAAVRALYGDPVVRFPPLRPGSDGGPFPAFDLGPYALPVILTAQTWGTPIEIYAKPRR